MKVLVIIPAYNESESIAKVVDDIRSNVDYDFVVINDGSRDDTVSICRNLGVAVVDLPLNLGIGGAVQTGYKYAHRNGYDVAIQFDGDGQHDARYLGRLVDALSEKKANLVIGSRFVDKGEEGFKSTLMRRIGIRWLSSFIRLFSGMRITDPTSGFRAADKSAIAFFCESYPIDYPEPESIVALHSAGLSVAEVPVSMRERQGGSSSIKALSSIYYMIKVSLAVAIQSSRREKKA